MAFQPNIFVMFYINQPVTPIPRHEKLQGEKSEAASGSCYFHIHE